MKKITQMLALASVAALCLSSGNVLAQENNGGGGDRGNRGGDRGNRGTFDPARITQAIRDRLDVKDDAEWKALEPLVQKVSDLRREQMMSTMRGAFRNRGGDQGGGTDRGNRGGFGGEASAEETALSDAVKNDASKDDLKAKMAAYRKAKAAKDEELKTAQDNLKKVLTTKQEAVALEMGLVR